MKRDMKNIEQRLEKEFYVSWYIIFYKLALGVIELLTGVGIALFGRRVFALYTSYVTKELVEDPHDFLAHLSETIVPNFLTHNTYIIIYLIALGAAKIAGAIGLIYRQNWGVDLLVGLTLLMFPFQLVHLIFHPSLLDFIYIFVGLLIALYLVNFKPKEWVAQLARKVKRKQSLKEKSRKDL